MNYKAHPKITAFGLSNGTCTFLIEMATVNKWTDVTKKNEKETGRHYF